MNTSILFSLIFFFAAACTPPKNGISNQSTQTQTTANDNEIRVGAVFPMTGPIATYGQESINGIKLALAKIDLQQGVKGKKIRLIVEDNKGEPAETANAVRKLIDVDKVHVLLGSVASSNTLAGAPIAQAAKVPMITPASTNEAVTKKGEFISRTCFTDNFQGVVMAKFAYESLQKKKAAIIIDVASDYSQGLAKVFDEKFKQLGGSVVSGNYSYTQGDKDFRSLLRRVKRANPDVIFVPGYYTEVGVMLQQARQMGITLPILGGDGWDSPKLQELAGSDGIEGNYISSHFSPDDTTPIVSNFVKEYKNTFSGEVPGSMAALAYDSVMVLDDALKRASDFSRTTINQAIITTKNFPGITGMITIDANRNALKPAVVLKTTSKGMVFKQKVAP